MPLLVESLKAEDGQFDSLEPHIDRMNRSVKELFNAPAPDLPSALDGITDRLGPGVWKIRVLYDKEIREVHAAVYQPRPYRNAVLVDGGNVDYSNKTVERSELDELTVRAVAAGGDTALIVKGGLVTDFTYANAAFFDGQEWWTPNCPLLAGTRRARLLRAGLIRTLDIRPRDLGSFHKVSPINAMLDLDEVSLAIECIIQEPDRKEII